MFTFVLFVISVTIYVTFLLWCLVPIIRRQKRRWLGWVRVSFAIVLLGANVFPPLAWPILAPIAVISSNAAERLMAVMLFTWTLPKYVLNIIEHENATATVVDVKYPIEISGVRYEPLVRTTCTTRRAISFDKGIKILSSESLPTSSGGDFSARAGNAIVAINHSFRICSAALRKGLQPGGRFPYREGGGPTIFVVRGEADTTQLYKLYYGFGPGTASVDDIIRHPPEIVGVSQKPAKDVISIYDLWPMRQPKDHYITQPAIINAYRALPATENACVLHVTLRMDFRNRKPNIYRTRKTDLRNIPIDGRSDFCRNVLARKFPPTPNVRLSPVTQ